MARVAETIYYPTFETRKPLDHAAGAMVEITVTRRDGTSASKLVDPDDAKLAFERWLLGQDPWTRGEGVPL